MILNIVQFINRLHRIGCWFSWFCAPLRDVCGYVCECITMWLCSVLCGNNFFFKFHLTQKKCVFFTLTSAYFIHFSLSDLFEKQWTIERWNCDTYEIYVINFIGFYLSWIYTPPIYLWLTLNRQYYACHRTVVQYPAAIQTKRVDYSINFVLLYCFYFQFQTNSTIWCIHVRQT